MPWNEPGGKRESPAWDQKGGNFDEILRFFKEKLGPYFGGEEGGFRLILLGIVFLLVVWLLSGFYIVQEGKRGVVIRFGRYVETVGSGLHWHFPYPIEQVEIVDVALRRVLEIGYRSGKRGQPLGLVPQEALMLTGDENIVSVQLAVHYSVADARDYLFNVKDPIETLRDVTESALREVVGRHTMDFVLTEGRSEVAAEVKNLVQEVLNAYKVGLAIETVNLVDAQPPEEVQDAFEDAIRAREDRERFINEAKAYANQIIPQARGEAARIIEEAIAYKERVVAKATGEANRFLKVVRAYEAAPEVTRKRLYLETLEEILDHSRVIVVDLKRGQPFLFLPTDKMPSSLPPLSGSRPSVMQETTSSDREVPLRRSARGRRGRSAR